MLELTLDTHVDMARSGARHGAGLFETIRVKDGRAKHLEAHLARLARGAEFLGLGAPPPAAEVQDFLETRKVNEGLQCGVLRMVAVDRWLMIKADTWQASRPERIVIDTSQKTTRCRSNPLNRFKTLSYLENLLLAKEAQERSLFEVVARNEAGHLTDGGRTNLFLVMDGVILTPPVEDGALPGIARQLLLEAGLVQEASLTLGELEDAGAVFLTNALQGVVPVHEVDGWRAKNPKHPLLRAAEEWLLSI